MGKTLMGSVDVSGSAPLLSPEQQRLFSSVFSELGPQALSTLGQQAQSPSYGDLEETFQRTYVQPAMQSYQQFMVPSIQQRFADQNASSSSALNQALAQSASELATNLGQNYGGLREAQLGRQQGALQQILNLSQMPTQQPIIQQREGLLGPLIGTLGELGAAALMY